MASTTFKTLCVRIPIDLADALGRLRAETGITRSEAVRRALDAYLMTRADKFVQPSDAIRIVSPAKGSDR
jgi:metal-responsive CopG/Arc/MetJ family transcriptional regulator